ncbi:ABC-2 transporter permease [Kyrpidia tusciae]|uniref:ABC-2 transporter permease n=1 Tax=Kyrpidia tusciae (strain DSM 2912 / NBRC 15312 / T2) TaxID=562970 RepID=D5WU77_KYRT2|nr:ABC-2 transporter permease [Kyrpidia tusciae]ADG07329.1 hypothetical protein Btus_2674 [Kyrpidia tusciae DSM 2912]
MRSFLVKDLIMYRKILAFNVLAILILCALSRYPSTDALGIIVWTGGFMMQCIQVDSRGRADVLLNSLPVTRRSMVVVRYLEPVVFGIFGFLLVDLAAAAAVTFRFPLFQPMGWIHLGGIVIGAAVWSIVMLPIYYWLGPAFIQYLVFVFAFVFSAAAVVVRSLGALHAVAPEPIPSFVHAMAMGNAGAWLPALVVTAVLYAASLALSVRLYERWEF